MMIALATAGGASRTAFDVLLGLHIACAVIGFAAVALTGVYAASARRTGDDTALEEARRYFRSRAWAEWLVLPVPVFGFLALSMRPGHHDFGDVWVIVGTATWAVASALLVGVVRPAERTIRRELAAGGKPAPVAGRRLMWASVFSDVLFVTALVFMVTQPP